MPYGDGTGPQGMGPRTGRGLGTCTGARPANRPAAFFGRRGFFRGRGRGSAYATMSTADEIKVLEAELNALDEERKVIEQRLKELKG